MSTIPLITAPVNADSTLSALNNLIDQINTIVGPFTNSAVVITGGTINGTAIGGTVPAAGAFTTLTGTSGSINGDTIATLTAAQTLTNKILTSPAITGGTLNNTVIGGVTPAAATFTTAAATSLTFSSTTGVVGTTTNDSAAAGSVGEVISANVAIGAPIPLTTNTPATVTSISLTAGDWDVWGQIAFTLGAGTLVTSTSVGISQTAATLPTTYSNSAQPLSKLDVTYAASAIISLQTGTGVVKLSGTTTIYLVTNAIFTVNTAAAFGFIAARRRR